MLILLGIIIYRMSISEGVEESVTVMHRQTILLLQKPTLRSREVLDVLSLLAIPILCYQTLRVRGKCCGSIRALGKTDAEQPGRGEAIFPEWCDCFRADLTLFHPSSCPLPCLSAFAFTPPQMFFNIIPRAAAGLHTGAKSSTLPIFSWIIPAAKSSSSNMPDGTLKTR